jgi:hypothetical protein
MRGVRSADATETSGRPAKSAKRRAASGSRAWETRRLRRAEKERDQDGDGEEGSDERKMDTAAAGERLGIEAARRESADGEDGRTRRRRDGRTGEPAAAPRRVERTSSLWR